MLEHPLRDNSVRDGNTQRLIRIESKLTRLLLLLGLDEQGLPIISEVKGKLK